MQRIMSISNSLGRFSTFAQGSEGNFFGHDCDCAWWTDEFTELTSYATFLAVFILNQCRSAAKPWGKLGVPALFGILHCHRGLARDELSEMLQSDRQASGNRGQVELFGETQFWTFDDHCHACRKDDGFLTTSQKVIAYLPESQPLPPSSKHDL
jgi:hypothetical protein